MAKERKSAAALAAREKARTKAQVMTERHEFLLEKAAEYFVLEDESTAHMEQAKVQAQQILDHAAHAAEAGRAERGRVVGQMLATGESKMLVAQRLGLSTAELRGLVEAAERAS